MKLANEVLSLCEIEKPQLKLIKKRKLVVDDESLSLGSIVKIINGDHKGKLAMVKHEVVPSLNYVDVELPNGKIHQITKEWVQKHNWKERI